MVEETGVSGEKHHLILSQAPVIWNRAMAWNKEQSVAMS